MPPPLHGIEECEAFYSLVPSPVGTRTFWLFRGWCLCRFKYRPTPLTVNWDASTVHFQGVAGRGGSGARGYDQVTLTTSAVLSDTNSSVVFNTDSQFRRHIRRNLFVIRVHFQFLVFKQPPHPTPGFRDSYLIIYTQEFHGLIYAGSR